MRIVLAGVAAVALTASGAYAQPNKDNGNNDGRGNASSHESHHPASSQSGDGGSDRMQPNRNQANRNQERGNGQAQAENRGNAARNATSQTRAHTSTNGDQHTRHGNVGNTAATPPREQSQDRRNTAVNSHGEQANARPTNGRNANNHTASNRGNDTRANGRAVNNRHASAAPIVRNFRYDNSFYSRDHARSVVIGCPPGLAKKRNGCTPPGQMNERSPVFGYTYRPSLFGLSHYGSGRYYYDDGYLFRLGNNGGIAGYIPLLGGALAIGNAWPASYASYDLPDYYVDYYNLGDPQSYRYADNVVYRVDPKSAAITSIAALLTGDDFTVGQPMPLGYDVYNVPYAYRDRYHDTPDAHYRYADGYVYRIDPETQLIAAAINLLV